MRPFYNFTSIDMYDHHYTICNPNFNTIKRELKCLHGKYFFEHLFEYMEQFWKKYKNNRKFSLLLTNLAHEGTLELLKYIDDTIYLMFIFKRKFFIIIILLYTKKLLIHIKDIIKEKKIK